MARTDGVHGPEPKVEFIDDWSVLETALAELRMQRDRAASTLGGLGFKVQVLLSPESTDALLHYVPALRDAYAECFELGLNLAKAVEVQRASQNDLYVPDAGDMMRWDLDKENP